MVQKLQQQPLKQKYCAEFQTILFGRIRSLFYTLTPNIINKKSQL
jgi:hypothetical protein